MQEEVNHKTIALTVNTTKMTARVLLKAMQVYLQHLKNKQVHPNIPQGKQTVKQLAKQNQGMTNIEITQKNIKSFERYARKYGVDFALKKDKTTTPPKYMVFFKARDQDAIVSAFKEFSKSMMLREEKPSIIAKLKEKQQLIKDTAVDQIKHKYKEQSL